MYEWHVPKNCDQQQINNKVENESCICKDCWTEFLGRFESASPFYSVIDVMCGKHPKMTIQQIDRQARLEWLGIQPDR